MKGVMKMNTKTKESPLMTSSELSEVLNISKSQISRWRTNGDGPREIEEALVYLGATARYRRNVVYEFVYGKNK